MKKVNTRYLILPISLLFLTFLSGCAMHVTKDSTSMPIGNIIEPVKDSRQISNKSTLTLPASVAIMFLPSESSAIPPTTFRRAAEKLKSNLLENKKYIREVSIVALEEAKQKVSLDYIRSLYDADIAIILSYTQDQRSNQSSAGALLDITMVSHFVSPSVKTETITYVEGKVVHIPSNALIFRSTGSNSSNQKSTPHSQRSALLTESVDGILNATDAFSLALNDKLSKFDKFDFNNAVSLTLEATPTDPNENWNKVDQFKYSGGGAINIISTILLLLVYIAIRHKK